MNFSKKPSGSKANCQAWSSSSGSTTSSSPAICGKKVKGNVIAMVIGHKATVRENTSLSESLFSHLSPHLYLLQCKRPSAAAFFLERTNLCEFLITSALHEWRIKGPVLLFVLPSAARSRVIILTMDLSEIFDSKCKYISLCTEQDESLVMGSVAGCTRKT